MASRGPTLGTIPLPTDERDTSPAELWEQKRAEGLSPEAATAYVQRVTGATPMRPVPAAPADAARVSLPTIPEPPTIGPSTAGPERIYAPPAPRETLLRSVGQDLEGLARVTVGNAARLLLPGVKGEPGREDYGRALRGAFAMADPVGTAAETAVAAALNRASDGPGLAGSYEEGAFDALLRATGTADDFERFQEAHPRLGLAAGLGGGALAGMGAEGLVRGGVRAVGRGAAREASEAVAERMGREVAVVDAPDALPMDLEPRMARAREQGFDVDRPLYHGTDEDFDAFDDRQIGRASGNVGHFGRGHYFSEDPAEAGTYARYWGGELRLGGNIKPVYARGPIYELTEGEFDDAGLNFYRNLRTLAPDDPEVREVNRIIDDVSERTVAVRLDEPQNGAEYAALYHPEMTRAEGEAAERIVREKPYNEWTEADHALVEKWQTGARELFLTDPANAVAGMARTIANVPIHPAFAVESFGRERLADILREAGYTGARSGSETVVFTPKDVRSRFARFDPANTDNPDLLGAATPAAAAALGVAGAAGLAAMGALTQDEDQMSSPNPTQATVPLQRDPAELWEELVAGGMDKAMAAETVQRLTGAAPEAPTEGAGLSGVLRTAAQGTTFGFGDEIEGLARAAGALIPGGRSPGEAYREGTDAARADVERFREDHPVGSLATEVVGGLVTGGAGALRSGTGAAVRGARPLLARALARPVALGAVEGAVAGAGAAEGGVGERITGALGGATLGGATGGLIQTTGALRGAQGRAQGRLVSALEREGLNPQQAVRSLRPGETLMDVGETGGPVQRLARAAESIPSEGAEAIRRTLTRRGEAAPSRIRDTLQREARLTFEDAVATADELATKRRANAAPLYEAAYQKSIPADAVADVFELGPFRQAYQRGRRIAQLEGADLPDLVDLQSQQRSAARAAGVPDADLPAITGEIPIQAIDYMKRGLDDLIQSRTRAGKMGRAEARALRDRLRGLLARVDEQVPEYAQARAQFAGDAAIEQAFEAARRGSRDMGLKGFLSEDPRRIAKAIQGMSPSEQEFYRRGALDAVRERLEKSADGRDLSRVLFGNTEMRARVRTLFQSDEEFRRFAREMTRERRMAEGSRFILGGSPTARIQADQADLLADSPASRLSAAVDAALAPVEAARRGARAVGARMVAGGGERTVNALAPFLTASGSGAARIGDDLLEAARRDAIRDEVLRLLTAGAAVPAGLAAGRATGGSGGR